MILGNRERLRVECLVFGRLFIILLLVGVTALPVLGGSVGTAFTYQGRLHDAGAPASGHYDFELLIFDDPGAASALVSRTFCGVELIDGLFSLDVDFGPVFDGGRLWVEVGVAPAGDCDGSTLYTSLDPRQEITATPYAIQSQEAENALLLGGLDASDFLRSSGMASGEDLSLSGTLTLSPGAVLVFPDGTQQTTAAADSDLPPTVTHPTRFVPSFLTCGDNAESDPAQWAPIAIATFRLNLDGAVHDISANFAGINTQMGMAVVAERVQEAIRSATGGQEIVTWDDRFVIQSALPASSSSLAPLESTGSPVDISGAGSAPWMDCQVGRGVAKEAVLDLAYYGGRIPLLDEEGQIDPNFRSPVSKIGSDSFNPTGQGDTKTIIHNLGRIPKRIRVRWFSTNNLNDFGRAEGEGLFNGSSYATIAEVKSGNPGQSTTTTTAYLIIVDHESSGYNWYGVIGENAENHFRIDVTLFNRPDGAINFIWEVE